MADLASQVPAAWAAAVRPFLQRADEFQAREPLVAYYLRTHVAFLCMQKRTKEDKEGTKFLMTLLDALEKDKKALGSELDGADGRTVLTRFALMLFAKADDEERAGNANLGIVRLFFASSVLFEATKQFTDDHEMDRIAGEKCKYAKYTAAKMKKALDAGQPYVSANPIEKPDPAEAGAPGEEVFVSAPISTAPPSSYMPKPAPPPLPPAELRSDVPSITNPPAMPASASDRSAPGNNAGALPALGRQANPAAGQTATAPPTYAPPPASNISHATQNTAFAPPSYAPPPQTQPRANLAAAPAASYTPPSAPTGFKPTVDDMIDAQKYARQAISALQFYDYANARQQLVAAMRILDGNKPS